MSVHLLLSAGRGPQECAWALAQLLHRLEADATRQNLETHRAQTVPGDRARTYRSVLIRIAGDGAEAFAASWTGTLCWQAPSPYRADTGRKNWYVIAQPCQVDTPSTTFAEADVDVVACRTGGPGGQHRNKASTAVRATHRPTGTVVVVDTERQFSLNRRIAMRLLRQAIQHGDEAAERAASSARWRIHDDLVRGNPTRIERPEPSKQDLAPQKRTRRRQRQSTRPRPPREESLIRQHEDR
ncbi:peptide chain release factor H [Microbispora catharanthi]|uniref:Peptide chain release factor H n=1 Tax=Microbispora catharanthi TaxID=1712871 RepID=A0A5N6BXU5_9ACTN|nr:peptide chain release factor H [Microbispora catharanthi]KAB8185288.1 peptide chain release factor H [Microbispora catharanthi]